jgi:hypothetical protein
MEGDCYQKALVLYLETSTFGTLGCGTASSAALQIQRPERTALSGIADPGDGSLITFYLLLSWIVWLTIAYYFNPSRRLSEEASQMQLPSPAKNLPNERSTSQIPGPEH